ncbi:hypothetical protein B0I27_102104 [Arcticibacter pallidicorallinus]|uniref:UbiA prenyltransferase family protein n=1 Tax=Arcticibacter pallidicorallinus TaxID=1259464 RepID=A0A2T0U8Z5_9SPHI|nr:hypothetical protein [Arcticibacter pallidicorallinus]PRY54338.1 hypothetical protein B0I27_102104 [Arcticibacter pallidicorallinus]
MSSDSKPPSIKKSLRHIADFLLFSNLFIAICAVAQGLVTYHLLEIKPDKHVLALLFCSTLALYNFSMLMSKPAEPRRSPFRRVRWIFSHYRLTISLTIIAIVSVTVLIFFLKIPSIILLSFLGLISIAYNIPLFTLNERKFGLRNIPGLKLFLIAIVWSFSCVLLPIVEGSARHLVDIKVADTVLLVGKRFLFIAAITVPFDIRDLFHDKHFNLKTIPVMLGERKAYLFCQLLLVIYASLLLMFTRDFNADFWALTVTAAVAGWLILKSEIKKDEFYYFGFIDGTMILQFLMILLFNLF